MESSICVAVITGLPARLHFSNHLFLNERHFFSRNFYAEVAAGNHQAVGNLKNFIQVVDALLVLDLGDDLDVACIVPLKQLTDFQNVARFAHERSGDEINALLDPEYDVIRILLRNARQRDLLRPERLRLSCS